MPALRPPAAASLVAPTLRSRFAAIAALLPDALAVVHGRDHLTYRELDMRSSLLAHELAIRGVEPGALVAICAERGLDLVVGLVGIVKAGAAYLPLDPELPASRLGFILRDSAAAVVLVQREFANRMPAFTGRVLELEEEIPSARIDMHTHRTTWCAPDDLAYVMYTSGSTGAPKGVMIPQRAVLRLVLNTNYVQLSPRDVMAHVSNVAFDAATFEIWGALLNGATIAIIDKNVAVSPREFAEALKAQSVTILFLTTALFNLLAKELPAAFGGLRSVLFGGEAVEPFWVKRVLEQSPPERLLHVYGPTETTTFATWYEVVAVEEGAGTVPIGRLLSNTKGFVLDAHGKPAPIGSTGELCLGGEGVAHGYLNRPALTAERFVRDPFAGAPDR